LQIVFNHIVCWFLSLVISLRFLVCVHPYLVSFSSWYYSGCTKTISFIFLHSICFKKSSKIPRMIRSRKSMKTNNIIGLKKKGKQWSTNHYALSNMIHTKRWSEIMCSGRVGNSCSTSGIRCVTAKGHEHRLKWRSCWWPGYA
jgi:hypothetical protein